MEVCGDVKSGTCNSDAPNIGAEYEIAIFDKDGNEKRRFGGKANCFVKGFMDYLYHLSMNGNWTNILQPYASEFVDIGGTAANRTIDFVKISYDTPYVGGARAVGPENSTTSGIVVGRSAVPVAIDDYNVGSIVGTTELRYGSQTVDNIEYNGNVATIRMTRRLKNESESVVSGVSSIGLYVRGVYANWSFMILRDVVPVFEMQPGEEAAIVYKMVFNGGS